MNKVLSPRDLTFIGMGAAIIAVLSQFSLPIPPVPVTLQIPAIILISIIYTWKQSLLSVLVYLLIGAIGIPVFASFNGGFNVIVGPTGGYLIGFLLMAFIVGYFSRKNNKVLIFISCYLALACDYLIGAYQLSVVAKLSIPAALAAGVYPFIIKDIIVVFISAFIALNVKKRIRLGGNSFGNS